MLELRYVPLSELRQHFLIGNAKRHDLGQLWDSFQRYGFRDPLAYDAKLNAGAGGIVEGNGRLETLASAYDDGQKAPQGIKVDEAGEWFVPVIHGLDGRTEAEALAYSIDHNSTVLSGAEFTALDISKLYDHEDYLDCLRELADDSSLPLTVDGDDLELLLQIGGGWPPEEEEGGDGEGEGFGGGEGGAIECPRCGHRFDT